MGGSCDYSGFRNGVLYCDTVHGGRCCEHIHERKRSDKAWRPVFARICVGLCAGRNALLLQRILLCMRLVDTVVYPQCGGNNYCEDTIGLSGIGNVPRHAVSYGNGNQYRVAAVGAYMRRSIYMAEQAEETCALYGVNRQVVTGRVLSTINKKSCGDSA